MPVLRQDVQMLDNSLDDLGNTLFKNRMAKQQQGNFEQEQNRLRQTARLNADERGMMLDARIGQNDWAKDPNNPLNKERTAQAGAATSRASTAAAAQTEKAGNDQAKETNLVSRLKQNTMQFHQKQIDEIANEVKSGTLTPEQGTAMVKQGVEKWDDWEKQSNPIYATYSSPDFRLEKTPKAGSETVRQVINPNYIANDPNSKQMLSETNTTTPLNIGGSDLPNLAPPATPSNEVTRVTKDGRKAIFDGTTKKFLRYAD